MSRRHNGNAGVLKTDTPDDSQLSLAGRVRNFGFAPSLLNSLFPLLEAIANAFYAMRAPSLDR